jgi:hypothetical protein
MVFMGYEKGSKASRAYDLCTGCVHVTHDAMFGELAQCDWSKEDEAGGDGKPFEFMVTTTTTYREQATDQAELEPIPSSPADSILASPPAPENIVHMKPPGAQPDLNADLNEDAPLRFHRMDNILGPMAVPGLVVRVLQEELRVVSADVPG